MGLIVDLIQQNLRQILYFLSMKVETSTHDAICRLELSGEIDAGSSIKLDRAIKKALAEDQKFLLIDCAELRYISSAGLGVFISYIDELGEKGGGFAFASMRDNVFEVFKLLGLHNLVYIAESENLATDYLQRLRLN